MSLLGAEKIEGVLFNLLVYFFLGLVSFRKHDPEMVYCIIRGICFILLNILFTTLPGCMCIYLYFIYIHT